MSGRYDPLDGRPVGDGGRLSVLVRIGRHGKALTHVVPAEIAAGPPIDVELSIEEIRRVADEFRQKQ